MFRIRDILFELILYIFITIARLTLGSDDGRLQLHPNEATVFSGDSVIFYCSKEKNASSPVDWYHIPTGERNKIHIYKSALKELFITKSVNYQTYFSVDYNVSTGNYNLRIRNVSVMYAGVYFCVDTNVGESTKQTELIVIDSPPLCQTNVSGEGALGENSCNLPPDYIGFSCSVNYRGNLAPILELYHDAGKDINETSVSNRVRYNSRSPAVIGTNVSSNMSGMFFHCEVKTVAQFPYHVKNSYRCNLPAIKVVYAMNSTASEVVTRREGISSCTINTNSQMMCEYKWKSQKKFPKSLILHRDLFHNDSTLIGSYRCMANCNLTGHFCSLEGQLVEFVAQDVGAVWVTIAPVFIVICFVLFFMLVSFVAICKFKQHQASSSWKKCRNDLRKQLLTCKDDCEDKLLKCKDDCEKKLLKCKDDCEEKLLKCKDDCEEKLLKCENNYKENLLNIKESAIPDPPKGPLEAYELSDGSIELRWKHPLKVGGMGYVIKSQILGTSEWDKIHATARISSDISKCNVKGLKRNNLYNFRIISQIGQDYSDPLDTEKPIQIGIVYNLDLVANLEVKEKVKEKVNKKEACSSPTSSEEDGEIKTKSLHVIKEIERECGEEGKIEVMKFTSLEAAGLAWLHDKIYILFYNLKKIIVFSGESPFRCLDEDEINIKEIEDPSDMISVWSANQHPTLFISDCSDVKPCLWKINIQTLERVQLDVEGKPKRLSMTSNGNLLVIVEFNSCYFFNIYSSKWENFELLKQTPLSHPMANPTNLMENSEWSFIHMYKLNNKEDGTYSYVIKISNSADHKKCQEIKLPFLEDAMFEPESIAVSEDNKIFIADYVGNRVFLFDPSTRNHRIISKQEHKIIDPNRLIYVKEKQQLIVGQLRNPFVKIFKLCDSQSFTNCEVIEMDIGDQRASVRVDNSNEIVDELNSI